LLNKIAGAKVSISEVTMSDKIRPVEDRLTTEQAARIMGVTPQTMQNWREQGKGPVYTQLGGKGGKVFYYKEDLISWERSQRSDVQGVG
jgi:phage terminase Nu1 subunit (DNA packaging protein)